MRGAWTATWVLLSAGLSAGCQGVAIRPDGSPAEEKCPEGAKEAMATLGLIPVHETRTGSAVSVYVDVTRKNVEPLIVYDGPIESETWFNMEDLPGRTRLYGRVWTGGPRVAIRYYSVRLPDGKIIPFCAVAGENGPGLPKSPGRPGFAAIESSSARVYVVEEFK